MNTSFFLSFIYLFHAFHIQPTTMEHLLNLRFLIPVKPSFTISCILWFYTYFFLSTFLSIRLKIGRVVFSSRWSCKQRKHVNFLIFAVHLILSCFTLEEIFYLIVLDLSRSGFLNPLIQYDARLKCDQIIPHTLCIIGFNYSSMAVYLVVNVRVFMLQFHKAIPSFLQNNSNSLQSLLFFIPNEFYYLFSIWFHLAYFFGHLPAIFSWIFCACICGAPFQGWPLFHY